MWYRISLAFLGNFYCFLLLTTYKVRGMKLLLIIANFGDSEIIGIVLDVAADWIGNGDGLIKCF